MKREPKSEFFDEIVGHIIASTLEDGWYRALHKVMTEGEKYLIDAGSYEDTYRMKKPLVIEMHKPGARPLAPIMPEALKHIAPPTTEEKIQEYFVSLITPHKKPDQHYTYGEDLWWQVEEVIKYFRKYGYGTACCHMVVGRPESFLFYNRELDYDEIILVRDRQTQKPLITRHITNSWNKDEKIEVSSQCLRGVDVWIQNGRLHFWCYFRSQDLWGGFPENYGGLQMLKEYIAEAIEVDDGPMVASGKDLHVYEHGWLMTLITLRKEKLLDELKDDIRLLREEPV